MGTPVSERTQHFFEALARGDLDRVRNFLAAGFAPDTRDAGGDSPLTAAAAAGHLGAVEALLEAGADVNQADGNGRTPLGEASRRGHPEIVRRLLHAGAEMTVDVNRNEQDTVLYTLDTGASAGDKAAPAALKSIPQLRGVESFDLDARWIAARAPIDHVVEALARARGGAVQRDVYSREITLAETTLLAVQFRAHAWTLVTELRAAPETRLRPEEARALSHQLSTHALFFETSDIAGGFRYQLFRANAVIEDFDTARAEELSAANDLVARKGLRPLSQMLLSSQRQINEAELENPERFADAFIGGQGIFIPAFAAGAGKPGDGGLLRIPPYMRADFERVDLISL